MNIHQNQYYLIRDTSAGVFVTKILVLDGTRATLIDSRRVWTWYGATELTELAIEGTILPEKCEISIPAPCAPGLPPSQVACP